MTPYEKFKSLPEAAQYLKEGLTFEKLDDIAKAMTDNEAADCLLCSAMVKILDYVNSLTYTRAEVYALFAL